MLSYTCIHTHTHIFEYIFILFILSTFSENNLLFRNIKKKKKKKRHETIIDIHITCQSLLRQSAIGYVFFFLQQDIFTFRFFTYLMIFYTDQRQQETRPVNFYLARYLFYTTILIYPVGRSKNFLTAFTAKGKESHKIHTFGMTLKYTRWWGSGSRTLILYEGKAEK